MLLSKETPFRPYKEGDSVWLDVRNLRTTHLTHKLRAKRYGPFQVIKALSHVAYQLQLPPLWKIHNVFHVSYLSPFWETTEHGTNFIEPPPDIIDGEPKWEVERIIGRRYYGWKKEEQYCICWKGYSTAHDTWEPTANVHASELVRQFLHLPPANIRAVRLRPEEARMHPSPFWEALFKTPGRHPLAC